MGDKPDPSEPSQQGTVDPGSLSAREAIAPTVNSTYHTTVGTMTESKPSSAQKGSKSSSRSKHAKEGKVDHASETDAPSSTEPSSDSDSSTPSSSEEETPKRKTKTVSNKARSRSTKGKSNDDQQSSSDSAETKICSSSDSDSSDQDAKRKKEKKAKARRTRKTAKEARNADQDSTDNSSLSDCGKKSKPTRKGSKYDNSRSKRTPKARREKQLSDSSKDESESESERVSTLRITAQWNNVPGHVQLSTQKRRGKNKVSESDSERPAKDGSRKDAGSQKAKPGQKMDFVRVDNRWENYNWILRPTGEEGDVSEYSQYIFKVRREFDYDGKVDETFVDIKSKALRAALVKILGKVRCVTLTGDTPAVPPNILFFYIEEIRVYRSHLKTKLKSRKMNKRTLKKLKQQFDALKVLIKYTDHDYRDTSRKLKGLLKEGKITFPLLWALFKPNEIVYAPTYDAANVPRAFKVDTAYKMHSILKGNYFSIEGQYLDYDGEKFGKADIEVHIDSFNGPRSISSLPCYPVQFHKDHSKMRQALIERGKAFVRLQGISFKYHYGMAFYKKLQQIVRINVDGRVMVDPKNFRRINPNYMVSAVKPEDPDLLPDCVSETDEDTKKARREAGEGTSDDTDHDQFDQFETRKKDIPRHRKKVVADYDDKKSHMVVEVEVEEKGNEVKTGDDVGVDTTKFTDEDYLIASPVVLGFSFTHKKWVEFDVAGIGEIQFANGAFESLVLPDDQKTVVRALVESHSRKESKNIQDVIQGKGEGLVTVLHGPPGCGKTLTAEGIAELLRKPLYMVSVGELGIRGGDLERNFSQIIDIAHCWGAILLLDEADVFLEKRSLHDIGRNALVSIFLRLLEYFQGIVFLTTNRVVTFDEAFQSRIHVGLRYGELGIKAKKEVWKMFIERVRQLEGVEVEPIKESDYTKLSQYELNGREIKNSVRTAQSLAQIEKRPLGMDHLLKVLFVGNVFAKDLKGPGYEEALKFYM